MTTQEKARRAAARASERERMRRNHDAFERWYTEHLEARQRLALAADGLAVAS